VRRRRPWLSAPSSRKPASIPACQKASTASRVSAALADASLYCGWTTDVDRRVLQHQAGAASRYTRSRLPVKLAGCWPCATRGEARRREAQIKALTRAEKLALLSAQRA
jgi:putative endonuclease